MATSPAKPRAARAAHSARAPTVDTLGEVASTLLIPLAARAHGDAMFPEVAAGDAHARRILERLGGDVSAYLDDRATVYGVLARTAVFRRCGEQFFTSHPRAPGVSLGAGLGHYAQWLADADRRWIDADLPEVVALRRALIPAEPRLRIDAEVDLSRPGWWTRLGLPTGAHATPVLLICEGVLMYLEPAQVQAVLHEVGERAPAGSRLLLDAVCWLAVGRASRHPSVRCTGAEFRWGPRDWRELTAMHPRLRLVGEHAVIEGYGWASAMLAPMFRFLVGVPLYAVAELEVSV